MPLPALARATQFPAPAYCKQTLLPCFTDVGGGYLHGTKTKGLRGAEALPHVQRWREGHALVLDGIEWSRARAQGRSGDREGYRALEGGRHKERGREGKGGGAEKASKSREKAGKKKAKQGHKAERREAEAAPASALGRWVHVPG